MLVIIIWTFLSCFYTGLCSIEYGRFLLFSIIPVFFKDFLHKAPTYQIPFQYNSIINLHSCHNVLIKGSGLIDLQKMVFFVQMGCILKVVFNISPPRVRYMRKIISFIKSQNYSRYWWLIIFNKWIKIFFRINTRFVEL